MFKRLLGRGGSFLLVLAIQFQTHGQTWPNEPAGSTISDWDMSGDAGEWEIRGSGAKVVDDATAPHSRPKVLQATYPVGFPSGVGPVNPDLRLPDSFSNEGYVGFWWKPSNPWQGHSSSVNKIFFLVGNSVNLYWCMYGSPGGPYQLRIEPQWGDCDWLVPNVNSGTITLGQWHRIELYFKRAAPNGIVRWWLNGQLVGNHTNVSFPSTPARLFDVACINPTWGGMGVDAKTQTDYFWFDHIRISQPNCGATGCPLPAGPAAPANFRAISVSSSQVDLTWTDNADNETGFEIERRVIKTGTPNIIKVGANVTSYSVTGLGPNHTFYFRVRAVNGNGVSAYSNEDSARTLSAAVISQRSIFDRTGINVQANAGTVRFTLPQDGEFCISLFDLSGRDVWKHSGTGKAVWNHGGKLRKGVYLVRAKQNGRTMETNYCQVW